MGEWNRRLLCGGEISDAEMRVWKHGKRQAEIKQLGQRVIS